MKKHRLKQLAKKYIILSGILIVVFIAIVVISMGIDEYQSHLKTVKGVGHTIHYAAIGDSLTAGYYATSNDKTYVKLIGLKLKDRMGLNVVTNLHAKRGVVLEWGITEINKVNAEKPDLITIELGTNDCNSTNLTNVQLFDSQLNNLIDGLTIKANRNPEIVLVTIWGNDAISQRYNAIIIKVGEERHISVAKISTIYSSTQGTLTRGPAGVDTYLGKSDTYHPNDNGMQEISEAVYTKLEPLIIKLVDNKKN